MKKLLPIVAGLVVLVCGNIAGQTAGRPATERYVIQKIGDYSTTNVSMNVASQALVKADAAIVTGAQAVASAAVASTNLQAALTAESLARASGDLVAMTNWQAVVYSLTNGAALGASALQPPATNTLAAAAAHAATAHAVTAGGGFQGGEDATATLGGAVGMYAFSEYGGAVGLNARSLSGGAVGFNAKASDGFSGGLEARATDDGTINGFPIDAIQLGTGGNSEPFTLQVYTFRLLNADGTIPVERFAATINASNAADRAYADAAVNAANLETRALIGPTNGCTKLTGTTPVVSGVTKNYFLLATNDYSLSVDSYVPRAEYTVEIFSDGAVHSCTLSGIDLIGSWTVTGTNVVVLVPSTGTVWHAYGRGL